EGDARLNNGGVNQRGEKLLLNVSTRGELKLNVPRNKYIEKSAPDDPLYQRGARERPPAPPAVQQTSGQTVQGTLPPPIAPPGEVDPADRYGTPDGRPPQVLPVPDPSWTRPGPSMPPADPQGPGAAPSVPPPGERPRGGRPGAPGGSLPG